MAESPENLSLGGSDSNTTELSAYEKHCAEAVDVFIWSSLVVLCAYLNIHSVFRKVYKTRFFKKVLAFVRIIVRTLVGGVMCVPILPLVVVLYVVLWVISEIVTYVAYYQFGDKVSKAYGMDALWGIEPKESKPFILVGINLEGQPEVSKLISLMENRVINPSYKTRKNKFHKFRQILQRYYGYYLWRDVDDFNIENHVKVANLSELYPDVEDSAPIDGEETSFCAEKKVCKYMREYGTKSLPEGTPQWECILLTHSNSSHYSLILRLHHSIGDGISFVRLLLEHMIDNPITGLQFCPSLTLFQRVMNAAWAFFLLPYAWGAMFFKGYLNVLHGKKLSGKKYFVTSKTIPLEVFKKIKKVAKCAITDVLFSCLSKALSSHFDKRNSPSENITIVFPVGFQEPGAPLQMINKWSMGLAYLPTPTPQWERAIEEEEDTAGSATFARLFRVREELNKVKNDATILAMYWLTEAFARVFPSLLSSYAFSARGITMGVSNMPGPPQEFMLMEDRVTSLTFWIPDRAPTGMGCSFLSYKGDLRVSFAVDDALISREEDVQQLIDDFRNELIRLSHETRIT